MQNKSIIIGVAAVIAIGGIAVITLAKQNNNKRLAAVQNK